MIEHATTKRVNELRPEELLTAERMLERTLRVEEHLFVLAYTPHAEPSEQALTGARSAISKILDKNQRFAIDKGFSDQEAEQAISEAIAETRKRQ